MSSLVNLETLRLEKNKLTKVEIPAFQELKVIRTIMNSLFIYYK